VAALLARPGKAAVAGAAVLVVQTSLLQSLLAGLGDDHALYGGLHAFDGLAALGIAAWLWARSRRIGRRRGDARTRDARMPARTGTKEAAWRCDSREIARPPSRRLP